MVQENAPAFAEAVANDMSKPKLEMYSAEIAAIVQRSLISTEKLEEWTKPTVIDVPDWQKPWSPTIYKVAKGVVLIIAPWNYPMTLSLQPFIGAIAAGCCAVVKPSEIAPNYSALLAELAPKYLDSNAFRIVLGGVPETTKLLELQWDHICYTGNSRVARIIATAAAKYLTPTTLELGGKCPVILDPATDIAIAAKRTLWGKAQNCGQVCVAPDYVLVPRVHQDAFIAAIKESCSQFFPDGSLASDSISRIVSPEHHSRLMDLLKRTKGEVVLGGKSQGLRIEITVVKNVLADDSLMEEEIFGPILPIVPVDSIQDAINFVRERPHPLVLYAFTENPQVKTQILNGTLSGSLVFNDTYMQLAVNEIPLGGVGESGHGRQVLKYTFDEFSYERGSIDLPKETEPFLGMRYAPYTEENFKSIAAPALVQIPEEV
ncbi:Aldehyde dehydrogenase [Mycena sanguinolenta]|uniref:Aldehyde dehydrogenase n=1 Tax=Mycena sanguinolenta TaxID=230812 RepID=A0A8H6Z2R4_9AGAR|nr:Aldehyde dehydrogenase [Mycena sanguinolenta]